MDEALALPVSSSSLGILLSGFSCYKSKSRQRTLNVLERMSLGTRRRYIMNLAERLESRPQGHIGCMQ
jgi:hypothetical protein